MATAAADELEDGELDDEDVTSSPVKPQLTNERSDRESRKLKSGHKRASSSAHHSTDKKEEHSRRKKKKSNNEPPLDDEVAMANYMSYLAYQGYPPASIYPADQIGVEWSKEVSTVKYPYDSPFPSDEESYNIERPDLKIKSSRKEKATAGKLSSNKVRGPYDSPSEDEFEFGIELKPTKSENKDSKDINSTKENRTDLKKEKRYYDDSREEHLYVSRENKKSLKEDYDEGFAASNRPTHGRRSKDTVADATVTSAWDSRKHKPSHGDYKEDSERRGDKSKYSFEGSNRKKKLTDTPMPDRPQCRFFMEGKCSKGDDCHFNHDFIPPRKPELCKFYVIGGCKKDACVYYHGDWPCKMYHETGTCASNDECLFSHAQLTDETKILPFREALEDRINYCHMRKQNFGKFENMNKNVEKAKDIPSLLELEVYPDHEDPVIKYNQYDEDAIYDENIDEIPPSNSAYDKDYSYEMQRNGHRYNYKQYNKSYQEDKRPIQNITMNENYYPLNETNFDDDDNETSYNNKHNDKNNFEDNKNYDNKNEKNIENKVDVILNDLRSQTNAVIQNQNALMPPIPINFSLPPPNFPFYSSNQPPLISNFPPTCMASIGSSTNLPIGNLIDNRLTNNVQFLANHNMPPPSFGQSLLGPPPSATTGLLGASPTNVGLLGPPPTSAPGLLGPPPSSLPLQNFTMPPPFNQSNISNLATVFNPNSNKIVQPSFDPFNASLNLLPLMQLPLQNINQPPPYDINQLMTIVKNAGQNSFGTGINSYSSPNSTDTTNLSENNLKVIAKENTGKVEVEIDNPLSVQSSTNAMNVANIKETKDTNLQKINDESGKSALDESVKSNKSTVDPRKKIEIKIKSKLKSSPIVNLSPPYSPELIDQQPNDESYLEVSVIGKKVEYVLYRILVESIPTLPEDITICNPKDPRLKRYRMSHHVNLEDGDKPINSNEGLKRSPRPYSLPDIVFLTTPAAPILEDDQQKKTKVIKRLRLSSSEETFKFSDSPLKSPPFPASLTPDIWLSPPGIYKNENISLNIEKSIKKPLDYRNDPRYKKKKIKSAENSELTVEPSKTPSQDTNSSKTKSNINIAEVKSNIEDDSISSFYHSDSATKSMTHKIDNETRKQTDEIRETRSKPIYEDYYSNLFVKSAFSSDPFEIDPATDICGDEASYEPQMDRQPSMEDIDFVADDKTNAATKSSKSMKEMFMSIDPTTSPFC